MLSGTAYADMSAPSLPDGFFFKPDVGADYQYTTLDYNTVPGTSYSFSDFFADSFNGGDVHVGARVHKYLGFEAGYYDTASSSKSGLLGTTASSSAKLQGENLDAMGYLPLGDSKAELIGLVGANHTSGKASVIVSGTTYTGNGSKTFAEYGGGAQYWFTNNLNARILVRYEDVNTTGINDAVSTSLGLNWQF